MKNTYGILTDKIFRARGDLSYKRWSKTDFQLFFDFPIDSFAYPHTKTLRIAVVGPEKNVTCNFLETFQFPATPTIEYLDNFLEEQPEEFYFWELITNMISKIWIFELITDLKEKSERYISALNALINKKKLDIESNPLIEKIASKMEKHETYFGFLTYASQGEIVVVRKFEQNEILSNGFTDRKQSWFTVLQEILKEHGYTLTYQWPYGVEIDHFPIEICLSFKSEKFKGNGLPVFFTK